MLNKVKQKQNLKYKIINSQNRSRITMKILTKLRSCQWKWRKPNKISFKNNMKYRTMTSVFLNWFLDWSPAWKAVAWLHSLKYSLIYPQYPSTDNNFWNSNTHNGWSKLFFPIPLVYINLYSTILLIHTLANKTNRASRSSLSIRTRFCLSHFAIILDF